MAQQNDSLSNVITIDGAYLEGVSIILLLLNAIEFFDNLKGGQILRNSTAFSVLLDIPIRVEKIRAGREKGGLRPQHLTGIQLLAQLSEAKLHNGNIGATEIYFTPKTIKGGNYLADTKTAGYDLDRISHEKRDCSLLGVYV
jgi:RNA 3'-terminal phosphate cyclase (ATP)